VSPIYESVTFDYVKGAIGDRYHYTRWGNPTVEMLERKVASLEGTEGCLAFSSGMSAITTSLFSLLAKGDHMVAQRDLYGATFEFVSRKLPSLGIEVDVVDHEDLSRIEEHFKENTKAVYLESPTNPLIRIVDFEKIAALAHKHHAIVLMDSTFGTPINQQPHKKGVDIVLHSATKYLNGHSDVMAGVSAVSGELRKRLWDGRKVLGGIIDPLQSYLLLRGLKTLAARMRMHNENGIAMAEFLADHPKVSKVYYPGLAEHPEHQLAKSFMTGFGGMMSFEVRGGKEDAERVLEHLKIVRPATSLGGVESLASMPVNSSHLFLKPEERKRAGINDNLIRLSVGIEDVEDLKEDLDQALAMV
jgi:cystathionine beta-lyase/cystathionine gamma-synthase